MTEQTLIGLLLSPRTWGTAYEYSLWSVYDQTKDIELVIKLILDERFKTTPYPGALLFRLVEMLRQTSPELVTRVEQAATFVDIPIKYV